VGGDQRSMSACFARSDFVDFYLDQASFDEGDVGDDGGYGTYRGGVGGER